MNLVSERAPKRRWLKAKYSAEYVCLRALVGLLHILPLDFGSWLMGAAWRLIAPHLRRHELALRHLAAAYPAKSAAEIDIMTLSMWTLLGRTFAESLMVERIVEAGRIEDCCGPLISAMKASGKGVVFVSLHTGNWELVVIPTITGGIEVAGVYQRMKNPETDAYMARMRRDRYPRGLFVKGADAGRNLMRIVREGGAVANDAHLGVARDLAAGDIATDDRADSADLEDLTYFGSAPHDLTFHRRKHSAHRFLEIIFDLVDHLIEAQVYAFIVR